MSENDDETEEPKGEANLGGENSKDAAKPKRRSFTKVRRDLSEDELSSPGVQKMLLDELDRLDGIEAENKRITGEYHTADKGLAVAEHRLKTHTAFDVISTGAVAGGSVIIGAAFSVLENVPLFSVLLAIGVVVTGVGVAAKAIKK